MPELKHAPKTTLTPYEINEKAWEKNNDLLDLTHRAFLHYPKQKIAVRKGDESLLIYPAPNYKMIVVWVKGQGNNQKKEKYILDSQTQFVDQAASKGLNDVALRKRLLSFPTLQAKVKAFHNKSEAKRIRENVTSIKDKRALRVLTATEYKEFVTLKKKGAKRTAKEQARIDKLSIKVRTTPVTPKEKQLDTALRIMRKDLLSMPLRISNPAHIWVNNRIMNIRTGFQSPYFMINGGANYMARLATGKSLLERLLENNNKKPTPAQKKKLKKRMSEIDRLTRDLE